MSKTTFDKIRAGEKKSVRIKIRNYEIAKSLLYDVDSSILKATCSVEKLKPRNWDVIQFNSEDRICIAKIISISFEKGRDIKNHELWVEKIYFDNEW